MTVSGYSCQTGTGCAPAFSAGEWIAVAAEPAWAGRLITRALGGVPNGAAASTGGDASVRLRVEAATTPFGRSGMRPVTRGAYSDGRRTLLIDACGAGFDLLLTVDDDALMVIARYRPAVRTRVANMLLPQRFSLLAGQVLVHYPVLWRAGWRGRVPLHASVVRTGYGTPLIAGPGGVGKSTVLVGLLADGAEATADNLCAADEVTCYGLAEPMRIPMPVAGASVPQPRTSHERIERPLPGRAGALTPDRLVLLERGARTEVAPAESDELARALIAGTYAAGELRRYWAFAATLALATGRGPAHPPIAQVAAGYAARLPGVRVRVGDGAAVTAQRLCGEGTP